MSLLQKIKSSAFIRIDGHMTRVDSVYEDGGDTVILHHDEDTGEEYVTDVSELNEENVVCYKIAEIA